MYFVFNYFMYFISFVLWSTILKSVFKKQKTKTKTKTNKNTKKQNKINDNTKKNTFKNHVFLLIFFSFRSLWKKTDGPAQNNKHPQQMNNTHSILPISVISLTMSWLSIIPCKVVSNCQTLGLVLKQTIC